MACDGGVDATRLGDESLLKIREPVSGSPVVISLPHAGTVIPDRFAEALNFPREDLWSDWYTDELYNFVFDLDVAVVQAG